jgi:hypothetical protein
MCSKEINFYKKISKKNLIKWIPLSSPLENLKDDKLKFLDCIKEYVDNLEQTYHDA